MTLAQIQVPYLDNHNYGVGVDLATNSPMGMVVKGEVEDVSGIADAIGATTKYYISRVHTTSDLETRLGIDAKASYGCGAFAAGASARFEFAQSAKVQSSSLFMTITATVALAVRSIKAPTLVPAAVATALHPATFAEHYGNMFVRSIGRGGMFVAMLQIDTTSSEEAESVASELKGAYGLFSAEAKAKFEEVQRKYSSELQISVYHEGGPIDLTMKDITDANQLYAMLQQWLKAFQEEPEKNARPYYVTLAPITIAEGAPALPNWAQIQHAQDVLVMCARERSQILDGANLMEFISQNPSKYDFVAPVTPADITKAFDGYQLDLEIVSAAASRAVEDPTQAMTPAAYAAANGKSYPQSVPPSPMPTMSKGLLDVLAAKGEALAKLDLLTTQLREQQPDGPARRGFDIGLAKAEGDTLLGPKKLEFGELLKPAEQEGYRIGVAFSVDRTRDAAFMTKGAAVAKADPRVAEARAADASVFFALGFDIATGLFGDPALGGQGDTVWGAGKQKIRDELNAVSQRGFDASTKLHLGPPALSRRL